MLRTKNLAELDFDLEDTWDTVLSSVAYEMRSTHHSMLGASPAQKVFSRDVVIPMQYVAEWDIIRKWKQQNIDAANTRENKMRRMGL